MTSRNDTADLVAQELYKVKDKLLGKVVRMYSFNREDIFNVKISELPEYSTLYKMLFESEETLNAYTLEKAELRKARGLGSMSPARKL